MTVPAEKSLRMLLRKLKRFIRPIIYPPLHKPDVQMTYCFLGSEYGGWPLLPDFTESKDVIYSFGLGTDISFDLAAIELYGCRILGFDPTPKSIKWLSQQQLPESFSYYPVGISDKDGQAIFFEPANPNHVSFSSKEPSGNHRNQKISAEVLTLGSIVKEFGDMTKPEIVKLDIEGFEYDVVSEILASGIRPKQLLIEFHHGLWDIPVESTLETVSALRSAGYSIFYVSYTGREYGFVFQS